MSKLGCKNLADEAKRMATHCFKNSTYTDCPEKKAIRAADEIVVTTIQQAKFKKARYGHGWSGMKRIS